MKFKNIVLLAGKWDTTPVVYNFLKENLGVSAVLIEEGVSRKEFLKKRAKKLGWLTVGGQMMFQMLIGKPMNKLSGGRIKEILENYGLKTTAIPEELVREVPSVNGEDALSGLQSLKPDLVIVHGTRIISKKILQAVPCPFINIHAGITPRYRGSHGGYWALINNDPENCGVTVHLVDPGIDTGTILAQGKIPLTRKDNFNTYPYLQLAEGLKLLKEAVPLFSEGKLPEKEVALNSALWHHPTIWGYVYHRLRNGVK